MHTKEKETFERSALLTKHRLRIAEAAFLLECHPDTVRGWMERGKVEYIRMPGGERRVLMTSLRPYL